MVNGEYASFETKTLKTNSIYSFSIMIALVFFKRMSLIS